MIILVFCGFSEKIEQFREFYASEVLSYKNYLGQDKVMKFGMVTKEGLVMTPILISYPEGSSKKKL